MIWFQVIRRFGGSLPDTHVGSIALIVSTKVKGQVKSIQVDGQGLIMTRSEQNNHAETLNCGKMRKAEGIEVRLSPNPFRGRRDGICSQLEKHRILRRDGDLQLGDSIQSVWNISGASGALGRVHLASTTISGQQSSRSRSLTTL